MLEYNLSLVMPPDALLSRSNLKRCRCTGWFRPCDGALAVATTVVGNQALSVNNHVVLRIIINRRL